MQSNKVNKILGINYPGHDTSAALMVNGEIIVACEQERLDRIKHSKAFPALAINECLKIAKIDLEEIDEIAVNIDPKFLIREFYLKGAMVDDKDLELFFDQINRAKEFYETEAYIRRTTGYTGKIKFHRHHDCHIAAAYYQSGFSNSLIVSIDGLGEIFTTVIASGNLGEITKIKEKNRYPQSLGLFYASVTHYLGWIPNCDEGIVMGLAPFGNPHALVPGKNISYYDIFADIIKISNDDDFLIDDSWIGYFRTRDKWFSDKFIEYFGPKRKFNDTVTDVHRNVAAALQLRLEDVVLQMLKKYASLTGASNLCISGGVGLNCSLNGKIYKSRIFKEIYIQPASGDAGTAVGACYLSYKKNKPQHLFKKDTNAYLGSRYNNNDISEVISKYNLNLYKSNNKYVEIAKYLSDGLIVAWFQGAAEFGPRALGNRSILAKPYPVEMKNFINSRVKFREEFRPFAPAVLKEYQNEYFDLNQNSPHMLIACDALIKKDSRIQATIHVDGTARVQTVSKEINKEFHKLIWEFYNITKIPVLLNTSFNVKGQPMVNSPEEAVETFMKTNIDILCIEDYILAK